MKILYRNKFIFWNLIALFVIKAVFSFSSFQLANIIDGVTPFSKEDVVSQTNVFRSNLGFSTLKTSPTLESAAWQKLQDMINGQYFAHTSPTGTTPWYWFDLNSYRYTYAGENLAIGFVDAKTTVDAWANSPSHRANLLNPNYKEIGIAIAPAKINNNTGYLIVQLFGTPRPTPVVAIKPAVTPKPAATPLVTPKPTIKPATTFSPVPTPVATPAPISPAALSDEVTGLRTVLENPVSIETTKQSPVLENVANSLNFGFAAYALGAFAILLVLMVLRGFQKQLVVQTAASFAIFLLALVVPVLQVTRMAMII